MFVIVQCWYNLREEETLGRPLHEKIGLTLQHAGVAIGAGFSGHGFKFASVMGEILADLALDGKTAHPIGFLSPDRFGKA